MLLGLLVACAIQDPAPAAPPAARAAAGVVDLRIRVPLHRPLLVDVQRTIDCKLEVTVLGKTSSVPMKLVDDWRFVDVHSLVEEKAEECARQYLKAFRTDGGRVTDPEINGLRVDLKRANDDWTLQCADERAIREETIDDILEQAPATSLWVALPKAAAPGQPFEAELVHLLRTALDLGKDLEATPAQLHLEGCDEATNTAQVIGSVRCTITESLPVGAIKLACDLAVLLEIDRTDSRLSRARFDGKATASSAGLMDVTGGGAIVVELKTTTGDAVAAAMREKPKFRSVEFRLEREGIAFTAPSYWFDAGDEDEARVLSRSLSDSTGVAQILVRRSPEKFDATAVLAAMKKAYPGAKVESSSNPLGKSVKFTLEREGLVIVGDMFALDAGALTFKVISPPSLLGDAQREFEAMRRTLKRPPKK